MEKTRKLLRIPSSKDDPGRQMLDLALKYFVLVEHLLISCLFLFTALVFLFIPRIQMEKRLCTPHACTAGQEMYGCWYPEEPMPIPYPSNLLFVKDSLRIIHRKGLSCLQYAEFAGHKHIVTLIYSMWSVFHSYAVIQVYIQGMGISVSLGSLQFPGWIHSWNTAYSSHRRNLGGDL